MSTAPLVTQLASQLLRIKFKLATAESCTGGLIAAACTEVPGSSAWFDRGWVTYSNQSKNELLGVDNQLIQMFGAVSEPVAMSMARGALERGLAHVSVAVTGIAGPSGATEGKPVGLVWMSVATPDELSTRSFHFTGDRAEVRAQAVIHALQWLIDKTRVGEG